MYDEDYDDEEPLTWLEVLSWIVPVVCIAVAVTLVVTV